MTSSQPQTDPQPVRLRVRRGVNYLAFLSVGALLGVIAGFLIDVLGPASSTVQGGSALAFLLALGGLLGAGIGALVGVLLEMALSRR